VRSGVYEDLNADNIAKIIVPSEHGAKYLVQFWKLLVLEDVFNTGQRPHIDEYEDQLFIVLEIAYQEEEGELVF
jgi:Mg2+ and Co2+ transporter CorA